MTKLAISTILLFLLIGIGNQVCADIIISEIMANAIDEDTGEFIELYNTGDEPVNVAGWQFTDGDAVDVLRAFGDTDCVIMPESYALILDSEYAGEYDLPPDVLLLTTENTTLGDGLQMNDPITLFDETGNNIIDTYSHPIKTENGVSVEKVDFAEGDTPENWKPCMDASGSTPGVINSYSIPIEKLANIVIVGANQIRLNQASEFTIEVRNPNGNIIENWTDAFIVTTDPEAKLFQEDEKTATLEIEPDGGVARFNLTATKTGKITIKVESTTDQRLVGEKTIEVVSEGEIPPQISDVIINEIMYMPDTKAGQTEWIELYNRANSAVDISGWMVEDAAGKISTLPADVFIEPHKYAILTEKIEDFKKQFPLVTQLSRLNVKNVWEIKLPSLNNTGDTVILKDRDERKIDLVVYEGKSESIGKSLERVNPGLPSADVKNWRTSIDLTGASPGRKNSVSWEFSSDKPKLKITPKTFNPSVGDAKISYEADINAVVTIKIYDLGGRLVRTLIDEREVGGAQTINWNGKDNRNRKLPVGAYICQIVAKVNDKAQTADKTLIIAKKL